MINKLKLVLIATVFSLPYAKAETINVANHGIIPGKDITYKLNLLIEKLKDQENIVLSFPKGQYDFYPENAIEKYRTVSNHDNGLKRMAFSLFGNKSITIEGNGSTFMMHGRLIPFVIDDVDGIKLKNFSINWVRSFHAEMEVIESDETTKSAVFQIDPKEYPFTIKQGELFFDRFGQIDPTGANMVFDPNTRSPIWNTNDYGMSWSGKNAVKLADNKVKLSGVFPLKVPPIGSVMVVYGIHPTSRLCPAIHVTNSKNLEMENVTVYDAGGMGLIVERTDNIALDGMKITSTDDRIVSTRADATHFIGCKGTIKVENCLFEHMLDDGINVHGAYVPVVEYLGNNQFLCEISHFQQWGLTFAEAGDKIALMSRETVLPFFETNVTKIKTLNEHRFVLEVADVPEKMPDVLMSVENLTWNPDLIMRNNIIRENRARSVLVTTKGKVLIEKNYFSSQMHGIHIEGDNNYWYESGAVQNVVIRNNEFVNSGFGNSNYYPLIASPLLRKEQRIGDGQYHHNIEFTNNTLKSFNGNVVKAFSVHGLTISGNTIELIKDYPTTKQLPAFHLDYCDDVILKKNKFIGFDWPQEVKQEKNCTNIKIK